MLNLKELQEKQIKQKASSPGPHWKKERCFISLLNAGNPQHLSLNSTLQTQDTQNRTKTSPQFKEQELNRVVETLMVVTFVTFFFFFKPLSLFESCQFFLKSPSFMPFKLSRIFFKFKI